MNEKNEISKMEEFMNVISQDPFQINLDVEDIIEKGLNAKENRRRRENIVFLSISLCILIFLLSLCIIFGIKYLVYFQLSMFLMAPIILIPISKKIIMEGSK